MPKSPQPFKITPKLGFFRSGTDVGLVRHANEDAFRVEEKEGLMIVSDGMGGTEGGQIASRLTIKHFGDAFLEAISTMPMANALHTGAQAATKAVYEQAVELGFRGMGATLVAVVIRDGLFYVCHVGDSRLYRFRGGVLQQLTRDHSHIQELLSKGIITPEDALHHPEKNVITRAIGLRNSVQEEMAEGDLENGDVLVACSDGLWGETTHPQLENRIRIFAADPNKDDSLIDELVDLAKAGGGADNITATVYLCKRATRKPRTQASRSSPAMADTAILPIIPIPPGGKKIPPRTPPRPITMRMPTFPDAPRTKEPNRTSCFYTFLQKPAYFVGYTIFVIALGIGIGMYFFKEFSPGTAGPQKAGCQYPVQGNATSSSRASNMEVPNPLDMPRSANHFAGTSSTATPRTSFSLPGGIPLSGSVGSETGRSNHVPASSPPLDRPRVKGGTQ